MQALRSAAHCTGCCGCLNWRREMSSMTDCSCCAARSSLAEASAAACSFDAARLCWTCCCCSSISACLSRAPCKYAASSSACECPPLCKRTRARGTHTADRNRTKRMDSGKSDAWVRSRHGQMQVLLQNGQPPSNEHIRPLQLLLSAKAGTESTAHGKRHLRVPTLHRFGCSRALLNPRLGRAH